MRFALILVFALPIAAAGEPISITTRSRVANPADLGGYSVREQVVKWEAKETAIVICDMWDKHWCAGATKRVDEMAPRMNQIVEEARKKGILIVHSPSDCMDYYKDAPQRKQAQSAPSPANAPKEIAACRQLPGEPPLPIHDSDGGCDDDPPAKNYRAWKRQHEAIKIHDSDAISDSGREIYNLMESRGIKNVMLMGVHTNMCVVGRSFGLRQMVRLHKNVVLVRDLTDAMYNPKKSPFVSHRRGTELVIEHIEKHICPSITAIDIYTHPAPAHVVFVIGEDEYKTEESLPKFAKEELEKRNIRCTFIHADATNGNRFPGMEKIKDADLVVLSVRRRVPPSDQLAVVREYLESGKPLAAIRTSSHAFSLRDKPDGWPAFDKDVLGGSYDLHYANNPDKGPPTFASKLDSADKHPILIGVANEFTSKGSLYRNKTLAKSASPLLIGRMGADGKEREYLAWTNTFKGGRIFYTSLGYIEDFDNPSFRRLLLNGILWAMERQTPEK